MAAILFMVVSASIMLDTVRRGGANDERWAMLKNEMVKQAAQLREMRDEINTRDEAIVALNAALETKHMERNQVQLTTGGAVFELVSAADVRVLEQRMDALETRCRITQDAATASNEQGARENGGDMPSLAPSTRSPSPPPPPPPPPTPPPPTPRPAPPRPPPRPSPRRRLSSSSNGDSVNEVSITGSHAVTSWNSHTPGLTSINCTGLGDGKLTCSGELHATDFVTVADGVSFTAMVAELHSMKVEVAALTSFVGMMPPPSPPPSTPPFAPANGETCKGILQSDSTATSGMYTLFPQGAVQPFHAYCDMVTDGGGWTMCATEQAGTYSISSETSSSIPFGSDGYRSDCQRIPFREVLYINHDANQKAWFQRDASSTILASDGYQRGGSSFGTWSCMGGACDLSIPFQLMVCDNGGAWSTAGFQISRYTNCYKSCGSWCGDHSATTSRYYGFYSQPSGRGYANMVFGENHGASAADKVMSVGVR